MLTVSSWSLPKEAAYCSSFEMCLTKILELTVVPVDARVFHSKNFVTFMQVVMRLLEKYCLYGIPGCNTDVMELNHYQYSNSLCSLMWGWLPVSSRGSLLRNIWQTLQLTCLQWRMCVFGSLGQIQVLSHVAFTYEGSQWGKVIVTEKKGKCE